MTPAQPNPPNHQHDQARAEQRRQIRALAARWSPAVRALLDGLARREWGAGNYTLIADEDSAAWMAVNVVGRRARHYAVHLDLSLVNLGLLAQRGQPPPDTLAVTRQFTVAGRETLTAPPEPAALEHALGLAQMHGPSNDALSPAVWARLKRQPYQPREADHYPWWIGWCFRSTGPLYLGAGVLLLGAGGYELAGLIAVGAGAWYGAQTAWGRRTNLRRRRPQPPAWMDTLAACMAMPLAIIGIVIAVVAAFVLSLGVSTGQFFDLEEDRSEQPTLLENSTTKHPGA